MAQDRRRIVITRLMQLAVVLHGSKRGQTVRQLKERLECSKSTLHRDLESLRAAGVGIQSVTVNGEVRYSLANWPVAAVAPTPLQLTALCLARDAVSQFEGTAAVKQLDELLKQWGTLPKGQLALTYRTRHKGHASLVSVLDDAIAKKQRIELAYQGERDKHSRRRKIEPVALRSNGEQLYLFAYDVERQDYRVFKAARMQEATMLAEVAGDHSQVELEERFKHSVKTWVANTPTTVVVRISREKARFIAEYPLVPNQRCEELDNGSVEVTADVNGITEALNWVLSWGAHAEALSPPELREEVAVQVREAAIRYYGAPRSGAPVKKANGDSASRRDSFTTARSDAAADQGVSPELGRRGRRVGG